jgi:hypothetical protein
MVVAITDGRPRGSDPIHFHVGAQSCLVPLPLYLCIPKETGVRTLRANSLG